MELVEDVPGAPAPREQAVLETERRRAEAADDSDGEGGGDADAERAAMIAGMSLNDDGDDSGDEGGYVKKERKAKEKA